MDNQSLAIYGTRWLPTQPLCRKRARMMRTDVRMYAFVCLFIRWQVQRWVNIFFSSHPSWWMHQRWEKASLPWMQPIQKACSHSGAWSGSSSTPLQIGHNSSSSTSPINRATSYPILYNVHSRPHSLVLIIYILNLTNAKKTTVSSKLEERSLENTREENLSRTHLGGEMGWDWTYHAERERKPENSRQSRKKPSIDSTDKMLTRTTKSIWIHVVVPRVPFIPIW